MSEEWPNGWYRDGQQARPSFTPRHDAEDSPYEATPYEPAHLATDKPLPENLITGASVAGTA